MTLRALLVDDEADVRDALAQSLQLADLSVETAGGVAAAIARIVADPPGVVVTDVQMPGGDGFALLSAVQEVDLDLPVVMLTGHGDVPMAVRAMAAGVYDFLEKPVSPARFAEVVARAMEKRRLVLENRALRRRVDDLDRLRISGRSGRIILGDAPASVAFRERLQAVAAAEAGVLIVGETGAGKEGAARALHALSSRGKGPFVAINCGAFSPDLAAAELFGFVTGAYPGAGPGRPGRFEEAEGGILFLDEVETTPADLQVQLLRVLEEREIRRVGASKPSRIDLRVVAAAKTDLSEAVAAGRFRQDLKYRLDVARLYVPALRDRLEDAPLLFDAFVEQAAADAGGEAPVISPEVYARLAAHDWPGNVRELRNAAERFAQGLGLGLGGGDGAAGPVGATLADRVDAFEKGAIKEALTAANGRVSEAAEALGLPRKTLYDKLGRHRLSGADFRPR